MEIGRYWKAVIAFITPGVLAYQQAIQHASPAHEVVTQQEWTGIVVAMILTGGGVALAANKPKVVTPDEPVDVGLDPVAAGELAA